ncbi:MAG: GNAT family N-acetyltransferase [Thermoplasmata archaeon]|nr:GNAT family N-acetyltransferase [Thermoplasmata archaeon]
MIITRQMRPSDLIGVYALMNTNLDGSFSMETIEYFGTMWPEGQFVAEDLFGNLRGALTGARMSNGRASIALFAVDSGYRGQGIGSRLLREFRMKCFMQGYTEIQLELRTTNISARTFYNRHGFIISETVPDLYGPGEDGYRMVAKVNHVSS